MKELPQNTCFFLGEHEISLTKRDLLQYYLAQEMEEGVLGYDEKQRKLQCYLVQKMEEQIKVNNNLFLVAGMQGFADMILLTAFLFRRFYPRMKITVLLPGYHMMTEVLANQQTERAEYGWRQVVKTNKNARQVKICRAFFYTEF